MVMSMTDDEIASHYIELWKKTVEVQQHFNELEWKIRGLALTAATFALGASGLAARNGIDYHGFSVGTFVLFLGLILWYGFYFVDRYWYHPLLIGSVKHGELLEQKLHDWLPEAGLTKAISDESPVKRPKLVFWAKLDQSDKLLHSTNKLKAFYQIGAIALVLAALGLQLVAFAPKQSETNVIHVIEKPASGSSLPATASSALPPQPAPSATTVPTAPAPRP